MTSKRKLSLAVLGFSALAACTDASTQKGANEESREGTTASEAGMAVSAGATSGAPRSRASGSAGPGASAAGGSDASSKMGVGAAGPGAFSTTTCVAPSSSMSGAGGAGASPSMSGAGGPASSSVSGAGGAAASSMSGAAGASSSSMSGAAGAGASSSMSGPAGPSASSVTCAAPSSTTSSAAAGVGANGSNNTAGAPANEGAAHGNAGAASGASGTGATPSGQGPAGVGAPGSASAGAGAATPAKPNTWRITFLGDSITETTCTSLLVYDALHKAGQTGFDLVGTQQNQQGCGVENPDRDVEGHSGYLVTEIVGSGPKASELPMWCAADKADLVLMHFGTNDAWNTGTVPLENIIKAFSEVIAQLRQAQPQVIVFVAQIIPLEPDGCPDCPGRVRTLNEMIPMWAASESTPESPIYVVDQWTGFDAGSDTNDRIHPNMQGAQKMADKWLAALQAHMLF